MTEENPMQRLTRVHEKLDREHMRLKVSFTRLNEDHERVKGELALVQEELKVKDAWIIYVEARLQKAAQQLQRDTERLMGSTLDGKPLFERRPDGGVILRGGEDIKDAVVEAPDNAVSFGPRADAS